MSKTKFYAVKVGKKPGVYKTWDETLEQVKGFSGADYKSFNSLEEAENYIKGDICESKYDEDIEVEIEKLTYDDFIAVVSGSYSPNVEGEERYSFGDILITNKYRLNLFKSFNNGEYMEAQNIAGQIEGAKQAILWGIENKKKRLILYYDYEGIKNLATGKWRPRKKLTREYYKFFKEKSQFIEVDFRSNKGRNVEYYNKMALDLAQGALLSKGYKSYKDGSAYFVGIGSEDWLEIIESINRENQDLGKSEEIVPIEDDVKNSIKRIRLEDDNGKIVIHCYEGIKSYVQGDEGSLYEKLISYAIESLPENNYVREVLNSCHSLNISEEELNYEFNRLLPNFPEEVSDMKHYNNLRTAVFNTMFESYMPDYTCLVTPVFRSTEYYLHRVLSDHLGKTTSINGRNKFSYFSLDRRNSTYHYDSDSNGLSEEQINYLNDLYNFYNKIRHPYSHWSKKSKDVQVITDMKHAIDLILSGLNLANEYYVKFPS